MEELLPHRGNYKKLYSYQKANAIYCLTYYFVEHYIRYNDRTKDQMLQAARSGKQNIIEGCAASVTSAKTEIRLLNVAKASLQELIEDFEDYLKTRGHRQWEEHSVELEAMRRLGQTHNDANFFMQIAQLHNSAMFCLMRRRYYFIRSVTCILDGNCLRLVPAARNPNNPTRNEQSEYRVGYAAGA